MSVDGLMTVAILNNVLAIVVLAGMGRLSAIFWWHRDKPFIRAMARGFGCYALAFLWIVATYYVAKTDTELSWLLESDWRALPNRLLFGLGTGWMLWDLRIKRRDVARAER